MYELTDGVLHDEVPADDEGAELADSDVAVDVGWACLGNTGCELRVARRWNQKFSQKTFVNQWKGERAKEN